MESKPHSCARGASLLAFSAPSIIIKRMMLSTLTPRIHLFNYNQTNNNNSLIRIPNRSLLLHFQHSYRGSAFSSSSASLASGSSSQDKRCVQTPKSNSEILRQVTRDEEQQSLVASASAVAAAIRRASTSPVEFVQRVEKNGKHGLVLPSLDFQRLCMEQLDLFRRIVDQDAVLSVYVRPAGSYVMDRLELRRVTFYTGANAAESAEIVILIGTFGITAGLHAAEASLSSQQVLVIPECRALVFPMVKHPFVVGFLVAELPAIEMDSSKNATEDGKDVSLSAPTKQPYALPPFSDRLTWEFQGPKEDLMNMYSHLSAEQRSSVINISRSLAMAYVMDQKSMLLQQSSWQNNVRMSELVEQIRGPLSSIRTLSKMLSVHTKRSEISYDIVEDILVQGDHLRDTLKQLQDAVYLTKANIVHYNEETLKKMHKSTVAYYESERSKISGGISRGIDADNIQKLGSTLPQGSAAMDLEMPMPPLALAALQQQDIRPCNVSDILADMVGAAAPLADKQERIVVLRELSQFSKVAIEESALRQALSNLIEGALLRTNVGGKVEIVATGAPGGGALVLIDDDGPDMHFMTQMHSLTPFGPDLLSEDMVEDNITWNFVAGLTVAREILESYGGVVRVISPRNQDAALGAGGTRVELWLPSLPSARDSTCPN